ncbi:Replicase family protein (plasmid) [Corynebacterium faecale]|uniref:replication initiation protein n=1 Tax=Corynebacterium faecale TaxID=1758466 RepID=UPI0025B57C71|nr:replication initiation protein [Corynebacterium faecale]WJY93515.1 Replicase family protein [Corynebacterium faecale]
MSCINSIARTRAHAPQLVRECHHDTLPTYVPVTVGDHAPSLWSNTQRYTDENTYQRDRDSWFDAHIVAHQSRELVDTGWCHHDAEILLNHLGRDGLHCAKDRAGITKAWSKTKDKHGHRTPLIWPKERVHLAEYIHFTNPTFAAVIVIDIDHVGAPGGFLSGLDGFVADKVEKLAHLRLGPNWIGINPESGKSQMIWYIDPVYRTPGEVSKPWSLLEALHTELQAFFEADKNFSHGWSRNPIYSGDNLGAYRWYAQHHEVFHMRLLSTGLWMLKGDTVATMEDKGVADRRHTQRFSSGRELINAARANTERARQAMQAREVLAGLEDDDLAKAFEASDPDVIDGVRVVWQSPGRAQRDVTAFQHALKTAGRLNRAGKKMTDDAIIDAYREAYEVAHSVGADDRPREEPPMRDLRSLARRVRGYVASDKRVEHAVVKENPTDTRMRPQERKALATLGRRGGKKAAERWKDPESDYAQQAMKPVLQVQKRKRLQGAESRSRVLAAYLEGYKQSETPPTRRMIIEETGLSRATVTRHLATLRGLGMLPE